MLLVARETTVCLHLLKQHIARTETAWCFLVPRQESNLSLMMYDLWEQPIVLVYFKDLVKGVLWHCQGLLIDIPATYSLVSIEKQLVSNWALIRTTAQEGFDGSKQRVGFSELKIVKIGFKIRRFCFGLFKMVNVGILGSNIMEQGGMIVDFQNKVLRIMRP